MDYFSAIRQFACIRGAEPPLPALAAALRTSWDAATAYRGVFDPSNPAGGQCYPTSRVVQWLYPGFDVVCGEVWTGATLERHFWNLREGDGGGEKIDLSWEQFPAGSRIQRFERLQTAAADDSRGTQDRCALLLTRVLRCLYPGEASPAVGGRPTAAPQED